MVYMQGWKKKATATKKNTAAPLQFVKYHMKKTEGCEWDQNRFFKSFF